MLPSVFLIRGERICQTDGRRHLANTHGFQPVPEHDVAIAAKPALLVVDVTDTAAVVHQALVVLAVPQVKGMPQLVGALLDDTRQIPPSLAGGRNPVIQPTGGNDATDSAQLGLAVDMGENRDKQVARCQGKHPEGVRRRLFGQFLEDCGGVELSAPGIPGKIDIIEKRLDPAGQAQPTNHHFLDRAQNVRIE
ncbi:hypothetical protein DESC_480289 [Desulfosarcina cetonica]|nr:hypothetical protein DESC_480289 [Desulfosarcina cetonica]